MNCQSQIDSLIRRVSTLEDAGCGCDSCATYEALNGLSITTGIASEEIKLGGTNITEDTTLIVDPGFTFNIEDAGGNSNFYFAEDEVGIEAESWYITGSVGGDGINFGGGVNPLELTAFTNGFTLRVGSGGVADTIIPGQILTAVNSGGLVQWQDAPNLLQQVAGPVNPFFGNRLQPVSGNDEGFYVTSAANGPSGYLTNATGTGNSVFSEFRAHTNGDPFSAGPNAAGIAIVAFGSNYFAPWLQDKQALYGGYNDLHILTPTNTSDIIFSLGNTGTNSLLEANQDVVFRLNKDKTILAPFLTNPVIDGATDDVLITKGWFSANSAGAFEAINEGSGTGIIVAGRTAANYGTIGLNAFDSSFSAVASTVNGATGAYAFAHGQQIRATGNYSVGLHGNAFETESLSIGRAGNATGVKSVTLGTFCTTTAWGEVILGSYGALSNTSQNPTSPITTNRLFSLANGTSSSQRSNAFEVLRNGTFGIGVPDLATNTTGELLQVNGLIRSNQTVAEITAGNGQVVPTKDWVIANTGGGSPSYSVYTVAISQTGTNAPTITATMENTIGAIVWTRVAAGLYEGTLTGAFTAQKTWFSITLSGFTSSGDKTVNVLRQSSSVIRIRTTENGALTDGLLNNASLEVRVYP